MSRARATPQFKGLLLRATKPAQQRKAGCLPLISQRFNPARQSPVLPNQQDGHANRAGGYRILPGFDLGTGVGSQSSASTKWRFAELSMREGVSTPLPPSAIGTGVGSMPTINRNKKSFSWCIKLRNQGRKVDLQSEWAKYSLRTKAAVHRRLALGR